MYARASSPHEPVFLREPASTRARRRWWLKIRILFLNFDIFRNILLNFVMNVEFWHYFFHPGGPDIEVIIRMFLNLQMKEHEFRQLVEARGIQLGAEADRVIRRFVDSGDGNFATFRRVIRWVIIGQVSSPILSHHASHRIERNNYFETSLS